MSNENDTSQDAWDEYAEEGDEVESPFRPIQQRASREAYGDPSTRQQQPSRHIGNPRETGKDKARGEVRQPERKPGPYRTNPPRQGYDAYGRPKSGTRAYREDYDTT